MKNMAVLQPPHHEYVKVQVNVVKQEVKKSNFCILYFTNISNFLLWKQVLSQDTNDDTKTDIYYGDAWFGSVMTAISVAKKGFHFVGQIKTYHSRYPKDFIEDKMKDWPGGSFLTLEATVDSVPLLAIGYKYNRRKVLFFVATRGSGTFEDGVPYEQKFPDLYGNVMVRRVPRPKILSNYFERSNVIDSHNQLRQNELALEQFILTNNCWFRLFTTLVGMTITDAYRAHKHHMKKTTRNFPIVSFADRLGYDLLSNQMDRISMGYPLLNQQFIHF